MTQEQKGIFEHMAKVEWTKLNNLQVGRYGEYFAKMEFTAYGFDVYSSEVDDHGVHRTPFCSPWIRGAGDGAQRRRLRGGRSREGGSYMVDAKPFTSQSPAATAPLKGEQNALRADDLSVTGFARDSSPYPRGAKAQSVPFFAPLPGELARVKRESER